MRGKTRTFACPNVPGERVIAPRACQCSPTGAAVLALERIFSSSRSKRARDARGSERSREHASTFTVPKSPGAYPPSRKSPMSDQQITCAECGNIFVFSAAEQQFYSERQLAS